MMSGLVRSDEEVGSWSWVVPVDGWPGGVELMRYLALAVPHLAESELLYVAAVEVQWRDQGGRRGAKKKLSVEAGIAEEFFVESVCSSFPGEFSEPRISTIDLMGPGTWLDSDGERHEADRLVDFFVTSIPGAVSIELQVHHDIWSAYAFDGTPHPDVRDKNAPRLAGAISGIEKVLGVETEPGDPTYFGVAGRYGIRDPRPEEIFDGMGPDVTDRL